MGATKKATHFCNQKNMYYHCVAGKPQRMDIGDPLTLTDKQAQRLGKKVKPVSEKATLDLTQVKTDKKGAEKGPDKDAD